MNRLQTASLLAIIIIVIGTETLLKHPADQSTAKNFIWQAPDIRMIPSSPAGDLIRYGRELIANTSFYLGPKGKIAHITNGMNCQNCHLDAGTRAWGNNYSGVFSTYPKFRERSGAIENIAFRVNDCIMRSLNGRSLDSNSKEMQAIYRYMEWLGKNTPKGIKPAGAGIRDIPYIGRAADPQKGQIIFEQNCSSCHGINGEGRLNADSTKYTYPPLWGAHSYNTGAGLYRISRFAGYVKENMPYDSSQHTIHTKTLTDEQAWDVAAFVNSQPRPDKVFEKDWPDISRKPFDYPTGPYSDSFSERQHKFGPFGPIYRSHHQ
jgi:thiosulfate dehydrogenase